MGDSLTELEDSQAAETELYASLKKPGLSDSEREALIQKINEQSTVRAAAYSSLAKAYAGQRKKTNLLTEAATQQLQTLKLVEQQLNATKASLSDKRLEALKMVEITSYSGKQYQAYASFLAACAGVAILYVVAGWAAPRLERRGVPFTAWIPQIVLLGGVIYLITRAFDLLLRRNDVFDEYAWPAAPRSLDKLAAANANKGKIIDVSGLPRLCVGSHCCSEGTEWVDAKGCVVSASPPSKSKGDSTLDGQELVTLVQDKAAAAGDNMNDFLKSF